MDIVQIGVQFGSFGALVWFLHHLVTRTIPAQQKAFQDALEAQLTAFSGELELERESRRDLIDAVKKNTETQLKACRFPPSPNHSEDGRDVA